MSQRRIATVLMLDVVGSTHVAAELGDARFRELSSRFGRIVRAALRRFGGREEDHAGDGFFASFPEPDRAIRCAVAIADEVRALGIEVRSGVHTGQTETLDGKTQGIAVVIGARVMSLADAGEILVTSTTKELVSGSGFGFEDLSAHELKGVPGTWQVYAVTSADGAERAPALPGAEAAERRASIEPSTTRQRRRAPLVVAGVVAALAIAAAWSLIVAGGDDPTSPEDRGQRNALPPESIVQLDPESGDILSVIDAPVAQRGQPANRRGTPEHAMAVAPSGVWTVRSYRSLFHVDARENELRPTIQLELGAISFGINLAVGLDEVWVAHDRGLLRVDPATGIQTEVAPVGPEEIALRSVDVAIGGGYVWLARSDGRLVRLDPNVETPREVPLRETADVIAFGHGSVWIGDTFAAAVTTHDPRTLRRERVIPVPQGVDNIAVGEQVWVLSRSVQALTSIDPVTGAIVGTSVPLGDAPTGIAAGDGAIWVGDEDGVIRRVDEATRQVSEIVVGAPIRALAYDEDTDRLWVDIAGPA